MSQLDEAFQEYNQPWCLIFWHDMVDKALFTNILVKDAKRWMSPSIDPACSIRAPIGHMYILLKLIEKRARDFHASLWSPGFEQDLARLSP